MRANHKHHCEKCTFLGRMEETLDVYPNMLPNDKHWDTIFSVGGKKHIDLYYCWEKQPTVLARYSAEPADYASGTQLAHANPHLRAAKNIAIAKGLISEGGKERKICEYCKQPCLKNEEWAIDDDGAYHWDCVKEAR